MYAALLQHALNIVWTAAICLIATGVGKLALVKTGMKDSDSGESIIFSAAVGFAVLGYSVFILGICQALYPAVFYLFTAICVILALAGWLVAKKTRIEIALFTTNRIL